MFDRPRRERSHQVIREARVVGVGEPVEGNVVQGLGATHRPRLYLESYRVIPKRNYLGAYGYVTIIPTNRAKCFKRFGFCPKP